MWSAGPNWAMTYIGTAPAEGKFTGRVFADIRERNFMKPPVGFRSEADMANRRFIAIVPPMTRKLVPLFFIWMVGGCSSSTSLPSLDVVRAQQASSQFGPTKNWRVANVAWAKSTQDMRDRAYRFCLIRRPKDAGCMTAQDYSLISANHAESNVLHASASLDNVSPYFKAIRERPATFSDARRFCLQIYQDAGSADARILGPCLSNAIGADFFGIVPVP